MRGRGGGVHEQPPRVSKYRKGGTTPHVTRHTSLFTRDSYLQNCLLDCDERGLDLICLRGAETVGGGGGRGRGGGGCYGTCFCSCCAFSASCLASVNCSASEGHSSRAGAHTAQQRAHLRINRCNALVYALCQLLSRRFSCSLSRLLRLHHFPVL
jgi:hypothetical protein